MQKVKTIFIGTAEFAVPVLDKLSNLEFVDLIAIITQPDKPKGRHQSLNRSPIKEFSEANLKGIDIIQPKNIRKSSEAILEQYKPELIIVAAYGQILSKKLIDYPKYGCLNLHGSLLPHLRGAVPVHMAILQGLNETGVTLQQMSARMDAGAIVSQVSIEIDKSITTEQLMKQLADKAGNLLEESLYKYISKEIIPTPQNNFQATFCFMSDISKEKAEINAYTSVELAQRMTRAFFPWPIAWFKLGNGQRVKVYKSSIINKHKPMNSIGKDFPEIVKQDKHLILVLKDGLLSLDELQLEGKKRSSNKDYFFLTEL